MPISNEAPSYAEVGTMSHEEWDEIARNAKGGHYWKKIQDDANKRIKEIQKMEDHRHKQSKKSPLDLLKEAREDKLISKKEYDILKDESPSKIKSRLKSLEFEVSDDDEPVVRATIDKDQYKAKPKPRKKQVAVKEIGHELHTRTHKMKKEPISKEEILNYVKMF